MITVFTFLTVYLVVASLIFASEKWVFGSGTKESIKVGLIFGFIGMALGVLFLAVI
jgi:hypothetical protein